MANQPQHLAMFLDGTWNTEDDGTNVLNAFHYTTEGLVEHPNVIQKRYYDRGVGTNLLNSTMGGGFGFGLEKNVREAYNWLIDNYNDGDKIFIFGFSRGAYTARSLVGLIGACGLVRRGAPLTTTQLWNGYTFISQHKTKGYKWWEKTIKQPAYKEYFGRLTDLEYRRNIEHPLINKSEILVKKWSRRIKISYLGIYDTVGAMGIDALGIPGIKSKMDAHHNLNITTIIQNCRHALAIDEHRSSFRLTPMLNYVSNDDDRNFEKYNDKVEQRWFVGAHSNIGGGYSNNVLFLKPFKWIMEGAAEAGLVIRPFEDVEANLEKYDIRDSFAELAGNVYPHLIRSKRNYRPIGRDDLVQTGYTLRPINETVDDSVYEIASHHKSYSPLNLISYLKRNPNSKNDKIANDPERTLQVKWPGELMSYTSESSPVMDYLLPRFLLIFWSVFATFGLIQIAQFFWIKPFSPHVLFYPIFAAFYVLVDWGEAKATIATNFYPRAVRLKAIWNIMYWKRLLGIIAFFTGFVCLIANFIELGLDAEFSIQGLWEYIKSVAESIFDTRFTYSIISTAVTIIVLDLVAKNISLKGIDKHNLKFDPSFFISESKKAKGNYALLLLALVVSITVSVLLILNCDITLNSIKIDNLSSAFLLICLLLMALYHLFDWVGKPMRVTLDKFGTMLQLQGAYTRTQVHSLFNSWASGLNRTWITQNDEKVLSNLNLEEFALKNDDKSKVMGWLRLREVIRSSLWRDFLGFIPLYSFILGTIMYMGSTMFLKEDTHIEFLSLNGSVPFWFGIVLWTAAFDILENTIHLRHLKNHSNGGSSSLLVLFGAICSFLKLIGFMVATFLSAVVIIFMAKEIMTNTGNVKWMIAIGFIYFVCFSLLTLLIANIKNLMPK